MSKYIDENGEITDSAYKITDKLGKYIQKLLKDAKTESELIHLTYLFLKKIHFEEYERLVELESNK